MVGNLFPPIVFGVYEILCGQVSRRLSARGWDVRVITSGFQLADRIRVLRDDEVLGRRLVAEARADVEARFDLDVYVDSLESFMNRSMAGALVPSGV